MKTRCFRWRIVLVCMLAVVIFVSFTTASVFSAATEDFDILNFIAPIISKPISFQSDLVFEPSTIFVNEPTEMTFAIVAKNVRQGRTIDVYESDADGRLLQKVLSLYDDGDPSKGDDIGGDGVFHNKLTMSKDSTKSTYFLAKIASLTSEPSRMVVAEDFTEQDLTEVTVIQTQAHNIYTQAVNSGLSSQVALQKVWTYLNTQPRVLMAAGTAEGQAVWWVDQKKILCGYAPNLAENSGSRGGSSESLPSVRKQKTVIPGQLKPGNPAHAQPGRLDFLLESAANNDYIGSNLAICLGIYKHEFEKKGGDEADDIAKLLRNVGFEVDERYSYGPGDGSVDKFKYLSKYGVIVITTHGDSYFGNIYSWWIQKYGEGIPWFSIAGAQIGIFSNLYVTQANIKDYKRDLVSQRLALFKSKHTFGDTEGTVFEYVVLPEFIHHYSGSVSNFPKSLVYIGACKTTFTDTLAKVFLSKGAKTYFGYSNYVRSLFAFSHGLTIFNQMVIDGKNTGEVTGVGDVDPWNFARFQRVGVDNLAIALGLKNGDFEEGNFNGWTTFNDARLISSLGPLTPPCGQYMAMLTCGFGGYINQSLSKLEQTFGVPLWANTITFSYNVVSGKYKTEEDQEEVFDNNSVIVGIGDDKNYTQLAFESMFSSTWYPISGINWSTIGGAKPDKYVATGWKTITKDITAYRGKAATLIVHCVSPSSGANNGINTAVVIDAFKIE